MEPVRPRESGGGYRDSRDSGRDPRDRDPRDRDPRDAPRGDPRDAAYGGGRPREEETRKRMYDDGNNGYIEDPRKLRRY